MSWPLERYDAVRTDTALRSRDENRLTVDLGKKDLRRRHEDSKDSCINYYTAPTMYFKGCKILLEHL